MPNSENQYQSVEDHYQPWKELGLRNLYLLLCDGARLTVRSQQVRAMNLVYALSRNQKLKKGAPVAVIGGGAAGITFAAAAACLGAHVKLFEAQKLMHLQLGSWHRPLHPEVYTWPEDTAYRPVSRMPLVGWTTGSANEVATAIVAKFRSLAQQLGEPQLKIVEDVEARIDQSGHRIVNVGGDKPLDDEIVIIATGFGIENALDGLPLQSYWRSDSLDQPFLGTDTGRIVIVGSGDGGLCDLLRACVPYTDQTAFLDTVLQVTLSDRPLRDEVKKIENDHPASLKWPYQCDGKKLEDAYCELKGPSVEKINQLLKDNKRPRISVDWLVSQASPFDSPSLPIYRFLVSRLMNLTDYFHVSVERRFKAGAAHYENGSWRVVRKLEAASDEKTSADAVPTSKPPKRDDVFPCNHVVFRAGQGRATIEIEQSRGSLWSVINSFNEPSLEMLDSLTKFSSHPPGRHEHCNEPTGWLGDKGFLDQLKVAPPRPVLLAEFVMAFQSPDEIDAPGCPIVFRIRIWLRGLAPRLAARYDLHPENHEPITRHGAGENEAQWLNTRNDYTIRIRLSDGQERAGHTVLGALHARYSLLTEDDGVCGAAPKARKPMPVKIKKDERTYVDGGTLTVADALRTLLRQSGYATQEGASHRPAAS